MDQFMLGAIVVSCGAIGLFFLRFWKRSGDKLFAFFAVAFWLLGVNWLLLALTDRHEPQVLLYMIRLAAFVSILIGIWLKNREQRSKELG